MYISKVSIQRLFNTIQVRIWLIWLQSGFEILEHRISDATFLESNISDATLSPKIILGVN